MKKQCPISHACTDGDDIPQVDGLSCWEVGDLLSRMFVYMGSGREGTLGKTGESNNSMAHTWAAAPLCQPRPRQGLWGAEGWATELFSFA